MQGKLQKERYTVQEIADMMGIDKDMIRHAVFDGKLKAATAGHDILFIRREDLLEWLQQSGEMI